MNRNSFGALLLATLTVTVFVSPYATPQMAKSQGAGRAARPLPPSDPGVAQGRFSQCSSGTATTTENVLNHPEQYCETQDLVDKIAAYFNAQDFAQTGSRQTGDCPRLSDTKAIKELQTYWQVPCSARKKLQIVIATVPDPSHTRLSLFFDRQIDAIEAGAQTLKYLYAGSTLPWSNENHPDSADIGIRLEGQSFQSAKEEWPGLIIFSPPLEVDRGKLERTNVDTPPLFVFVVGERPTDGINKKQFDHALDIIKQIKRTGAERPLWPSTQSVNILGPTFSGSLFSLAGLLEQQFPAPRPPAFLYSGSISSGKTISWFNGLPFLKARTNGLDWRVTSFQPPSELEALRMQIFFSTYGDPKRMAYLSESETAYGNQSRPLSPSPLRAKLRDGCSNEDGGMVPIYFPRDISQLRSAYQQNMQSDDTATAGERAPRTVLPLNLEDSGGDDTVPVFAARQNPLSQESILVAIVSQLQECRIKLVLLRATNPLDMLFLARYLRIAYSDAHIVIAGSDLLLPREIDDPRLQGIMELSSYPLLPVDLGPVLPVDRNPATGERPSSSELDGQFGFLFPSHVSEGTFRATVALLCKTTDLPVDVQTCLDFDKLPPRRGMRSWLTVLGRERHWPLVVTDTGRNLGGRDVEPENRERLIARLPVPTSWIVFSCICISLVLVYLIALLDASVLSVTTALANLAPVKDKQRSWAIFIGELLALVLLLILVGPWLQRWPSSQPWTLGLAVGILLFIAVCWSNLSRRHSQTARILVELAILCIVLVCVVFFRYRLDIYFSLYRYMNLESGVSPVVPVILLLFAGWMWCWYTTRGLLWWHNCGMELPKSRKLGLEEPPANEHKMPDFEKSKKTILRSQLVSLSKERNKKLRDAVRSVGDFRTWLFPGVALAGAVLAWGIAGHQRPVRSLEGPLYDWFYAIAMLFVLLVLLFEVGRTLVIWLELRQLLQALDRLPLRRAFKRMKDLTRKPLWQLGSAASDEYFAIFSREREIIANWESANAAPDHKVTHEVAKLDHVMASIVTWFQDTQKELPKSHFTPGSQLNSPDISTKVRTRVARLQIKLASVCAAALNYLGRQWQNERRLDRSAHPSVQLGRRKVSTASTHSDHFEISETVKCAEDFVSLFYFNVISCAFMRIRTLVIIVAGMYVFALLSFASYPFEPKQFFHALMLGLFLFITGTIAFVLAQMHRDPILSYITQTKPGELGFDFWLRLGSFVALPLFSLLAVKFPEIGSFLFSWLAPAAQAFR